MVLGRYFSKFQIVNEYQDLEIFPESEIDWIRLCMIEIAVSFVDFRGNT